jgi:potassium efflux system protein
MGILNTTTVVILLLPLCTLAAPMQQPDTTASDSGAAVRRLEQEILALRRKEIDTETRIERLSIDIQAIEKKWRTMRETDTESRLLIDSISGPPLRTRVLWERLSSYKIDLENASLLLECYQKQRSMLRLLLRVHTETDDQYDQWKAIIDSTVPFRSLIAEECRWRNERRAENRFELAALDTLIGQPGTNPDDRRLLRKRKTYLENKLVSDSVLAYHGVILDSTLSGYQDKAYAALKQITLRQQTRRMFRRIIGIWSYELQNVDGKPLTVGKIILALFIIIAGLKIAQIISRLIARFIKSRSNLDTGVIDAGQKLFFYIFAALFTLYALHMLQVPLTAFTVAGGALALGVGFGSQNIIKNFISGIILLLERPMKTGDFLEIDGAIGTVESIGMRSTRIRTPDNVHMVIPNSSFLEKNVVNWTLADKLIRMEVQVGLQYGSPVYKAKQLLLDAAVQTKQVLNKPEPEVLFSDFGDNALTFQLLVWMRLGNIIDRKRILSALHFTINDLFNEAGIVIAFPQRDLHIDTHKPIRVHIDPPPKTSKKAPE